MEQAEQLVYLGDSRHFHVICCATTGFKLSQVTSASPSSEPNRKHRHERVGRGHRRRVDLAWRSSANTGQPQPDNHGPGGASGQTPELLVDCRAARRRAQDPTATARDLSHSSAASPGQPEISGPGSG